jgi:hypothetical protein
MRTELAIRFSGLPAIITIQQAEHRWLFKLPISAGHARHPGRMPALDR